jgi:hypothetical protein
MVNSAVKPGLVTATTGPHAREAHDLIVVVLDNED